MSHIFSTHEPRAYTSEPLLIDHSVDPASPFQPPKVNVTFPTYHNVYSYSAGKLWIAYGIATFFAFLLTAFGLVTIVLNNATYSMDFSTTFRVAREAYIDAEIRAEDTLGRSPLPSYLAKSKIWLSANDIDKDAQRTIEDTTKISASSTLLGSAPQRSST